MSANRSCVRNEFTNRKKLVKNLARKEASSFCRQQVANVTVFVPFTHTQGRSQDFSKGAGGGGGGSHGAKTRLLARFSCRFYHLLYVVCSKHGLQRGVTGTP